MLTRGSFTISLDFELFWGVRARKTTYEYKENLLGTHTAIPKMLLEFKNYGIHATWAIVGLLFCNTIEEMKSYAQDSGEDWYKYLDSIPKEEQNEEFMKMHSASLLIDKISKIEYQEISTHSFSHVFTKDIDSNTFKLDMEQSLQITSKKGYLVESIIFPRNQIDTKSINILKSFGIKSYRSNPTHWAYANGDNQKRSFFLRIYRLLDTYINLSGEHIVSLRKFRNPLELRASMFLRPYNRYLKYLESLKVKRIKMAMSKAAIKGKNFHLWWHPHNFGVNQDENMKNLIEILKHFKKLEADYGMVSLNMSELVQEFSLSTANIHHSLQKVSYE